MKIKTLMNLLLLPPWALAPYIHVSVYVLSDVLFLKAFKLFNYLLIFQSKYRFGKLRSRAIQEKYKHIHENNYF